ncbi:MULTISPECIES: dienelactone hydrolase family protein [unclassified Mesorhizobium]|jgi:carboxymethylenebutenolidase|uniref:dienelactone hydrolase family protein n=1 Tax=unclassified Mesorhizobium TaxID=325217 RepID=UPI000FE31887|nr:MULTISPECIES: dienelactone hydrolase family protein [unclassified Mesorhizobium]MDG4895748.1 dienelactone hydrolase family protein [Mesorhizobium sp. WSM4976]RWH70980.1 MAG: dienelactone hydrolase family protein [Mesorhizobium sp.]RWL27480.1 MAG: dienelactone hydrolase family protein [Mesorhizobium sp.]RWL31620.1 MAG: dienelactone hydrolase family protein [Mesorhizobium sp.]RWL38444.1 MAG: dienelactone hydrolase family protein [Mesorhizobium sp.]
MTKRDIEIKTQDGTAKGRLFRPAAPAKAGVILYMDIFGPRPVLDQMAERLAGHGYAVLVPDLFYRYAPYGPFDPKTAFAEAKTKALLLMLSGGTTQGMTIRDGSAFLDAFAAEGIDGPIGVVGYCMGGARALNAAASYPDRIVAAASFHGGNLASDAADSPHRKAASIKARVYVGVAGVDGSFPPEQSARLAEALRVAEVDHTIENYVGVGHGWCIKDHGVYDEVGAERHWKRLTTFFKETLG